MNLRGRVFISTRMEKSLLQIFRSTFSLLSILVVMLVGSYGAPSARSYQIDEISKLKQLYDGKRYFELREDIEHHSGKTDRRLFFFRGALANVFYQPKLSAKYLGQYISQARNDDAWLPDVYAILADDFVKTYDYAKAIAAYRTLLDRFRQKLQPDEIEGYENVIALYGAFRATPRQTVTAGADSKAGEPSAEHGWSVAVEANGQRVMLGLDTGADLSLLAKSVAEKLGVRILDTSAKFGSITSINVQTKFGVLPVMKIGNAVIRNAIFIVMDDQALTFPDGSMITGVIGFPVIAGLRQITFNNDGTVSIPHRPNVGGKPNMCLDGSKILFRGEYENTGLTFVLDTGAQRSILYLPFLQAFESEIKSKYDIRNEKFTGIGGTEETPAYIVRDFTLRLSGRGVRLPEIRLLTKALTDNGKHFYGNIGQDLIKRFRRMTLDFVSMRIAFE
jgi:hypothetical protein